MGEWTTKRILITARTYPVPAQKGVEVSCTGGITDEGQWIRLFPVPYRLLDRDKRFRKYQWIEARVSKAADGRPESYTLDLDSIGILTEPLPTENAWAARREIVFPLKSNSMCGLQSDRDARGYPTLGFIKPERITRLRIDQDRGEWTPAELARLRQMTLWRNAPAQELEKVPYRFAYEYECAEPNCGGHDQICTDWEMGQAWRKWSRDYGSNWESKFRDRFERGMADGPDTHFYVGTIHRHPNAWIIVGLWYAPSETQPRLF